MFLMAGADHLLVASILMHTATLRHEDKADHTAEATVEVVAAAPLRPEVLATDNGETVNMCPDHKI